MPTLWVMATHPGDAARDIPPATLHVHIHGQPIHAAGDAPHAVSPRRHPPPVHVRGRHIVGIHACGRVCATIPPSFRRAPGGYAITGAGATRQTRGGLMGENTNRGCVM